MSCELGPGPPCPGQKGCCGAAWGWLHAAVGQTLVPQPGIHPGSGVRAGWGAEGQPGLVRGAQSRAAAPWGALGSDRVPTGWGGCPGALWGAPRCPAWPAMPCNGASIRLYPPAPLPCPECGASHGAAAAGVQRSRAGVSAAAPTEASPAPAGCTASPEPLALSSWVRASVRESAGPRACAAAGACAEGWGGSGDA